MVLSVSGCSVNQCESEESRVMFRFMSSYLISAPPMMICGIKTSGTMLAAVFGSATNDEMSNQRYTTHRSHEHDSEIDPEHSSNLQQRIADQDIKNALNEGKDAEGERLRNDVVRQANLDIALALQDRPIADDVIGAVGQAKKHCDDQAEKQERRNVISRSEIVCPILGVAQDGRNQQRQHRRHPDRNDEVGAVAQFTYERTAQQGAKLRPFIVPANWQPLSFDWRDGQRRGLLLAQGNLFDVLNQSK